MLIVVAHRRRACSSVFAPVRARACLRLFSRAHRRPRGLRRRSRDTVAWQRRVHVQQSTTWSPAAASVLRPGTHDERRPRCRPLAPSVQLISWCATCSTHRRYADQLTDAVFYRASAAFFSSHERNIDSRGNARPVLQNPDYAR